MHSWFPLDVANVGTLSLPNRLPKMSLYVQPYLFGRPDEIGASNAAKFVPDPWSTVVLHELFPDSGNT